MSDEIKEFALREAERAKDLVAEELMKRATGFDIDASNVDEYDWIHLFFEFSGATHRLAWNSDGFDDPQAVYGVFLRLLYDAEDAPRPKIENSEPEPMGFVWGSAEAENAVEDEADSDAEELWK